jgi:hypothetical protein
MSKSLIFVMIPYSVSPADIADQADRQLQPYQITDDRQDGKYDYLCGLSEALFDDPIAEGRLPAQAKRILHRRICMADRLPPEPLPDGLITPDGIWHDRDQAESWPDRDWPEHYRNCIAADPNCWIVAFLAHS